MSALVRLGPSKSGGPLGIPAEGQDLVMLTPNMLSIRLPHGEVTLASGKEEGEVVGNEIQPNQKVLISLPFPIKPRKYTVMVSYNPELLEYAQVSGPVYYQPEDGHKVKLLVTAYKKIDLLTLSYIFELSMID